MVRSERAERPHELLRVLDRLAAEQTNWLMRLHGALMFGGRVAEPPPPEGCCGADASALAPLMRLRATMLDRGRTLLGQSPPRPETYGAFMAAVEAYGREARRLETQFRRQQAETDPLTGVHNRQGMVREIRREWTRARRTGRPVCVALADLDFFKSVNDTYGHAAGDRVLCMAARFFARRLRPYDLVYRYGGEEFLFCLPDTDAETARRVLDRLRELMARVPVALDCGTRVGVTCSIGVAQMVPGRSVQEAIDAADRALYAAKDLGRNRVVLAPPPSLPSAAGSPPLPPHFASVRSSAARP